MFVLEDVRLSRPALRILCSETGIHSDTVGAGFDSVPCVHKLFPGRAPGEPWRVRVLAIACWLLFFTTYSGLALPVVARAQTPDEETASTATYAVSGTVVNSVTGESIPHALVQVFAGAQRSMLTDFEGRFRFEGLPGMETVATARKPGFFSPQQLSPDAYYPGARVKIGPDTPPITLKLVPEGVISGHVTGANDEPLEGFQVRAQFSRIVSGRRQWDQRGSASTRADGSFRIAGLPPGTYYLKIEPGGNRTVIAPGPEGAQGYRPEYYAGADDLTGATPLAVQPGQTLQADFSVPAEPVFTLAGAVGGFMPGQGVWLELTNTAGDPVFTAYQFNPATGTFKLQGVPAGSYILRAHANAGENRLLTARTPLNVGGNSNDLRLFLQPMPSIPIIVRREETGIAEERPRFFMGHAGPGPPNVRLVALDGGHNDSYATFEGTPPAMTLRNVEPGRYSVVISPTGPFYVLSAVSGSTDLLNQPLVVVPGSVPPPIEVVLRDDGGSITGTVQAEQGVSWATVIAIPDRKFADPLTTRIAERRNPFQVQGGPADQFQFGGLAPGDYSLLAFDRVDGLEYANPEALRDYLSHAVRVTLHAGEKKTVSLGLITRGEP